MSFGRVWFCFRCRKEHPVVKGVIQCDASAMTSLTPEQMEEAVRWAMEHPIEVTEK
jgi:hypothetical protein